jgi:hypothetical protein
MAGMEAPKAQEGMAAPQAGMAGMEAPKTPETAMKPEEKK